MGGDEVLLVADHARVDDGHAGLTRSTQELARTIEHRVDAGVAQEPGDLLLGHPAVVVHEVVLQVDQEQRGVPRVDLLLPRIENLELGHVCEDSAARLPHPEEHMKIGLFIPIGNNGWVVSTTAPQYMPTFELNRSMTCRAEDGGADFVFSMGKWRGYGGATEHWDHTMESLTLMAGLAAVTSTIDLYATVHPLLLHPAVAAKMLQTIDDISGGRAGVNIVTGWNKYEFSQMGMWPGDDYYARRYEYAAEWLEVVDQLWAKGRLTHHGRFFDLDDCVSQPRPQRVPRPPVVCAGMSEPGLRFTVERCDAGFVGGGPFVFDLLAASRGDRQRSRPTGTADRALHARRRPDRRGGA